MSGASMSTYTKSGNVLDTFTIDNPKIGNVVPDSVGETVYKFVCR